jgi:urease accessory protein
VGWQLECVLLYNPDAMKTKLLRRLVPLLLLAGAPLAQAHPGHGPADLAAGFLHPFTGWDHLLAMLAVGMWAAQLGRQARWALPSAFVCAMTVGAAVGIAGYAPRGVDAWILASVLVLGLLLACAAKMPLRYGIGLVALAGFFHGAAHGAEMPFRADSLRFLSGMVAATALLHALGVAAGTYLGRRNPLLVRFAGAGVVAGGVALLLT